MTERTVRFGENNNYSHYNRSNNSQRIPIEDSFCLSTGKDKIIVVSKDDYDQLPSPELPLDDDAEPGLILPDGEINWSCPCLGGTVSGPCGYEFREAFTCFFKSTSEPKGAECMEQFGEMQKCMETYPDLFNFDDDDDDDIMAQAEAEAEKRIALSEEKKLQAENAISVNHETGIPLGPSKLSSTSSEVSRPANAKNTSAVTSSINSVPFIDDRNDEVSKEDYLSGAKTDEKGSCVIS